MYTVNYLEQPGEKFLPGQKFIPENYISTVI